MYHPTVEAVESSAGLTLIPDALKAIAKPLCQVRSLGHEQRCADTHDCPPQMYNTQTVQCQVIVRRFDDAQKKLGNGKGRSGGGRERSATL
jgi:endonuclease G